MPEHEQPKVPLRFITKLLTLLSRSLLSVLFRSKKGCAESKKEFEELFPPPTEDETRESEERTPPSLRWWCAQARQASAEEAEMICKTCNRPIGSDMVKECPNCHVVMHAECYTRPYSSYQTPDCQACYLRCYSR